MDSTAITTRKLKAVREGRFWGVNVVFRCRGGGAIRFTIARSLPPRGAAILPNGPSAGMARSSNAPRFGLEFAEAGAILALG